MHPTASERSACSLCPSGYWRCSRRQAPWRTFGSCTFWFAAGSSRETLGEGRAGSDGRSPARPERRRGGGVAGRKNPTSPLRRFSRIDPPSKRVVTRPRPQAARSRRFSPWSACFVLLAFAVSYLPPRGRGPIGPRPDKPLKGRLWPGVGGRASPDLRIFGAVRASRARGGLGPRTRDRTPTPKRIPYDGPDTL